MDAQDDNRESVPEEPSKPQGAQRRRDQPRASFALLREDRRRRIERVIEVAREQRQRNAR